MKATEKTFNGLRISGFIALFLLLALSGLCCYLIAGTNETWSVITGIVGLCLLVVCLLGFMDFSGSIHFTAKRKSRYVPVT